jgi:hypothetical protein
VLLAKLMEHITQDQAQVTEMDEGRMDTKE